VRPRAQAAGGAEVSARARQVPSCLPACREVDGCIGGAVLVVGAFHHEGRTWQRLGGHLDERRGRPAWERRPLRVGRRDQARYPPKPLTDATSTTS
jgi:hypothetical protein